MISQPARNLGNLYAAMLVGLILAACSSQVHRPNDKPAKESSAEVTPRKSRPALTVGEQAAVVAVRQLGVPYRYGGSSRNGFDCSGLVHYAYSQAGKSIPRTTNSLWQSVQPVPGNKLRVGDLLFFNIDGKVSHVGLYLGSRRFVHAPSTGRAVTIAELDSVFYKRAFVRGGRP
jgi:cell wall-associated NlpC family hydrolase